MFHAEFMNKKELITQMMDQLEKDKQALIEATQHTLEAATHEESKPENEYDTRGLEASYLAGAQSKRVAEIEEALAACKYIKLKNFTENDAIASTAVVELDCEGKTSFVFLMPKAGGIHLKLEGKVIQVVTGTSPLGEALVGQKVGDSFVVETGRTTREYEVVSVW